MPWPLPSSVRFHKLKSVLKKYLQEVREHALRHSLSFQLLSSFPQAKCSGLEVFDKLAGLKLGLARCISAPHSSGRFEQASSGAHAAAFRAGSRCWDAGFAEKPCPLVCCAVHLILRRHPRAPASVVVRGRVLGHAAPVLWKSVSAAA